MRTIRVTFTDGQNLLGVYFHFEDPHDLMYETNPAKTLVTAVYRNVCKKIALVSKFFQPEKPRRPFEVTRFDATNTARGRCQGLGEVGYEMVVQVLKEYPHLFPPPKDTQECYLLSPLKKDGKFDTVVLEGQTLTSAGVKEGDCIFVWSGPQEWLRQGLPLEASSEVDPLRYEHISFLIELQDQLSQLMPVEPPFLIINIITISASIASIVQAVLLIVDMRSRHTHKKMAASEVKQLHRIESEIKAIRVLMSDGNWVEFESWQTDPDKLKDFVRAFRVPSASPKPLQVIFLAKRGQVRVNISDSPESQEQLDFLIDYLKTLSSPLYPPFI